MQMHNIYTRAGTRFEFKSLILQKDKRKAYIVVSSALMSNSRFGLDVHVQDPFVVLVCLTHLSNTAVMFIRVRVHAGESN